MPKFKRIKLNYIGHDFNILECNGRELGKSGVIARRK
jgi:hypothetical protein